MVTDCESFYVTSVIWSTVSLVHVVEIGFMKDQLEIPFNTKQTQ